MILILCRFFSGIFHFVKDNYFRTLSSSSDDEYDSDDSAGENDISAMTAIGNEPGKAQGLASALIHSSSVPNAAALTTSSSIQFSGNNSQK